MIKIMPVAVGLRLKIIVLDCVEVNQIGIGMEIVIL
jgi:hypothetical protein